MAEVIELKTKNGSKKIHNQLSIKPANCVYREGCVTLYQQDCLLLMDQLVEQNPDGLFDMIFADPPYFLSNGGISCQNGKMVSVDKGEWDESGGIENNHKFNLSWLEKCQQLLKKNASIWVSGTHHVIHSVGYAMQSLDMKILNSITWEKPNPPPNLSCRYFTHSTETLLWATKSEKSKHYFNYQLMRTQNEGKQMKSVWRMTAPSKSEKKFGKHPTQKPLSLLDRVILSSTKEGDLVFDPFMGSGTTGVSALRNNRNFVGCEKDINYLELAKRRLKAESKPLLGVNF